MQFAQVMDGGIQLPFAPATLQTTHAEAIRALAILHLSKDRFDRSAALAINRLTPLRAQLAFHPLSRRHRLRYAAPRRRCIAQGGPLIAILTDGDEQLAFLTLARRIGLRPVAGIGDGSTQNRTFARHRLDVHLSLIEHHRELVDVIRLAGHIGSQNDLAGRDDGLCIVALNPCMDAPVRARGFCSVQARDRVRSCIRP